MQSFSFLFFEEHGIAAMVSETHSLADLVKAMELCTKVTQTSW